jgi:hypothetical protein
MAQIIRAILFANAMACGFRFNPATDSDLKPASHSGTKPATIPI